MVLSSTALSFFLCISLPTPNSHNDAMDIQGDFTFGMLLSLHESPNYDDASLQCKEKIDHRGIETLEAALYALDMINRNPKILPGVRLGMKVRDTCWSEVVALCQSLQIIAVGTLASMLTNVKKQGDYYSGDLIPAPTNPSASVIGIIGSSTVEQTIQTQNLIKLFNIPQIGYLDTVPELDDRIQYPTYMRVIPSDNQQARVIRDILKKYDWTYVSMIRNSGVSAEGFSMAFRKLVEPLCEGCRICIAKERVIESHYDERSIDGLLLEIAEDELANVVILYCDSDTIRQVYQGIKRLDLIGRFTFIVSDNWEDPPPALKYTMDEAWGTISVHIAPQKISRFRKYYESLKPSQNKRNPWFGDFWENTFNCTLREQDSNHPKRCTDELSLVGKYQGHRKINYVMKAIFAIAHGLHKMMVEVCGVNYYGVCSDMIPINSSMLMNHLRDISFRYGNDLVTINDWRTEARYIVKNLQKLPNGKLQFFKIGDWVNGTLQMWREFQSRDNKLIISRCSSRCPLGYHKEFEKDNKNPGCCWKCKPCSRYQYVSSNQEKCIECPKVEWSNRNSTGCERIPPSARSWFSPMILLTLFFTIIGLIATLFTLFIFIKYMNTPIVKASSRELCYLILFSMVCAHLSVFILFVEANKWTCTLARIIPAVSLTTMFAGLLTKISQIARISLREKGKLSKRQYRLVSTSTQFAITLFCVAIEIAICFGMMLGDAPTVRLVQRTRDHLKLSCDLSPVHVMPLGVLILFLHALCILYAIKARDVPRNFNEARFIGFSLLISVIIWIIFFTLYLRNIEKAIITNMCITLHSSVTLIFLFFPKLYIIIFEPEKNNEKLFSRKQFVRTNIGPRIDSIIVKTFCGHVTSRRKCFAKPEDGVKSRKSVAIQTDSKFPHDMEYSDEDETLCNDDLNPYYESANMSTKYLQTISETVDDNNRAEILMNRRVVELNKFSSTRAVRS